MNQWIYDILRTWAHILFGACFLFTITAILAMIFEWYENQRTRNIILNRLYQAKGESYDERRIDKKDI